MIAGRRHSRAASQQAQQQAKDQGAAQQQATAEQVGNFKKAFSVCLEAKDYMVKYCSYSSATQCRVHSDSKREDHRSRSARLT